MADGPRAAGLEAGRQTPAHESLSRSLWLRKPGALFRFLWEPGADPGLTLERVGQAGGTLAARIGALDEPTRATRSGLLRVTATGGLVFGVASDPMTFLQQLAPWARQALASVPALGLLADAGAALLKCDPAEDAAAQQFTPQAGQIAYDPALWDELLPPTAATLAAALAAATPGERLWFWLAEEEAEGTLPLIVQPVAWDLNHDRTNWLIDRNSERGAGAGATGTAVVCDDGTLQFLGEGLVPWMLEHLARWVAKQQADYPVFGRLAGCQLVVATAGRVTAVHEDARLWAGVQREPIPGTIHATAAVLEALQVGEACWFWLTGGRAQPAFLHLAPTATDPEGVAFQKELPRLYKRFATSYQNAICGVMNRPTENVLLFSSQDARTEEIPTLIQALLVQYGASYPALQVLTNAALARFEEGAAPQMLAAGQAET